MTDTDPDTRRLAELLGAFDPGPVPDPDLHRVTSRGARMRTARRLETTLAVLTVIAVTAGAVLFVTSSPTARPPVPPAGPSPTATSAPRVTGTVADWRAAVERAMPYPDQIHYYGNGRNFTSTDDATNLADASMVREVFRYTGGGRTTTLIVTANVGGNAWDIMRGDCHNSSTACHPVQQTSAGPVIVTNATGPGVIAAINRRPSGTLIMVSSLMYDVTSDGSDSAELPAGLAGDVDKLVTIATSVPEPALAPDTTPAPASSSATPTVTTAGELPTVSPRVTVKADQHVPLGDTGVYLTLSNTAKCVIDPANRWPAGECKSFTDGNLGPGVGLQSSNGVVTGEYVGSADAARIVISKHGVSVVATIVALDHGRKNLAFFYLNPPPALVDNTPDANGIFAPSVTVTNAAGEVVATLP